MEFALQAWSPYLKRDIQCLEKVQWNGQLSVLCGLSVQLSVNCYCLWLLEQNKVKMKRKGMKMVEGFIKLSYKDRLTRLGLTSLTDIGISLRGDLIETYKNRFVWMISWTYKCQTGYNLTQIHISHNTQPSGGSTQFLQSASREAMEPVARSHCWSTYCRRHLQREIGCAEDRSATKPTASIPDRQPTSYKLQKASTANRACL